MSFLLCFGLGYSARVFARRMLERGWQVLGTTRTQEKALQLRSEGFETLVFDGSALTDELEAAISQATHILVSAAPGKSGDPVLACTREAISSAGKVSWIGYLSTVGVYGDHDGEWVDEASELRPCSERSRKRVAAERAWLALGEDYSKPVMLFRLSGIYGPGRGPLEKVRSGQARRIVKPGQVFNRIHVEDIANALEASVQRPRGGAIYNVTDDEPAPPQDVVACCCELLGVELPPEIPFEDADLTPMGRSFYGENKRVSNTRIKEELGVELAYPTFREGMTVLARAAASEQEVP